MRETMGVKQVQEKLLSHEFLTRKTTRHLLLGTFVFQLNIDLRVERIIQLFRSGKIQLLGSKYLDGSFGKPPILVQDPWNFGFRVQETSFSILAGSLDEGRAGRDPSGSLGSKIDVAEDRGSRTP